MTPRRLLIITPVAWLLAMVVNAVWLGSRPSSRYVIGVMVINLLAGALTVASLLWLGIRAAARVSKSSAEGSMAIRSAVNLILLVVIANGLVWAVDGSLTWSDCVIFTAAAVAAWVVARKVTSWARENRIGHR